jgi:hypothetical protein
VADDAEQFNKTKGDVENLELLMKSIQGSISGYAPLYLAIKKVNIDICNELGKFYQRYPEFAEIGKAVKDAFEFHNTRIDDLVCINTNFSYSEQKAPGFQVPIRGMVYQFRSHQGTKIMLL